jgi:hypothetical protein
VLTARRDSVAEIRGPADLSSDAGLNALTVRDPRAAPSRRDAVIAPAGPIARERRAEAEGKADVVRVPGFLPTARRSIPAEPAAPDGFGLERRNALRPFQFVEIRVGAWLSVRRERFALEL